MRFNDGRAPGRRGQGTVEMALVLGIVLLIVFSIFDLGRALAAYLALNEAATIAVDYGTKVDNVSPGSNGYPSVQQVTDQARVSLGPSIDPSLVTTVRVDPAASMAGQPALKVTIGYTVPIIGPFLRCIFSDGKIALTAIASHNYPD